MRFSISGILTATICVALFLGGLKGFGLDLQEVVRGMSLPPDRSLVDTASVSVATGNCIRMAASTLAVVLPLLYMVYIAAFPRKK